MSANLFRVVLIVDGEYISAWQYLMLKRLQASGDVGVVAVILRQPQASGVEKKNQFFSFQGIAFSGWKNIQSPSKCSEASQFSRSIR